MIKMCGSDDDNHASFPHRIVTPLMRLVVKIENKREVMALYSTSEYVICTFCDHWVERTVTRCRCRYRCHPNMP